MSTLVPGRSWFASLCGDDFHLLTSSKGDTIFFGISRGFVTLPGDPKTPIICVGPGTGVAPMRAIVQHRLKLGAKGEIFRHTPTSFHASFKGRPPKKGNTLYFGCRSATKDQHYGIEWESHAKFDDLHYRLAASRDGPEGVRRIYVQHLIERDAEHIWDVVGKRNGWVYISG